MIARRYWKRALALVFRDTNEDRQRPVLTEQAVFADPWEAVALRLLDLW